jgi:hypothetical protein
MRYGSVQPTLTATQTGVLFDALEALALQRIREDDTTQDADIEALYIELANAKRDARKVA